MAAEIDYEALIVQHSRKVFDVALPQWPAGRDPHYGRRRSNTKALMTNPP